MENLFGSIPCIYLRFLDEMGPVCPQNAFVECVSYLAREMTLTSSMFITKQEFLMEEENFCSRVEGFGKELEETR